MRGADNVWSKIHWDSRKTADANISRSCNWSTSCVICWASIRWRPARFDHQCILLLSLYSPIRDSYGINNKQDKRREQDSELYLEMLQHHRNRYGFFWTSLHHLIFGSSWMLGSETEQIVVVYVMLCISKKVCSLSMNSEIKRFLSCG